MLFLYEHKKSSGASLPGMLSARYYTYNLSICRGGHAQPAHKFSIYHAIAFHTRSEGAG